MEKWHKTKTRLFSSVTEYDFEYECNLSATEYELHLSAGKLCSVPFKILTGQSTVCSGLVWNKNAKTMVKLKLEGVCDA